MKDRAQAQTEYHLRLFHLLQISKTIPRLAKE